MTRLGREVGVRGRKEEGFGGLNADYDDDKEACCSQHRLDYSLRKRTRPCIPQR
jgi:hypothetical protein